MPDWEQVAPSCYRCRVVSATETETLARKLAARVEAGDVLALIGDLGAGKTHFVKSFAAELGVPAEEVNSPTFTLIQEYHGRKVIRHCDTYRLRHVEEFADLGLDELFAPDGITLIEWADRVDEYLPLDRLQIRILIDSPTARTIELSAIGRRSKQVIDDVVAHGPF